MELKRNALVNCQALVEYLTQYLDGRLPIGQRLAFELHLRLCRDCRAYLHNFRATIHAAKLAHSPIDVAALPEMPTELVDAIVRSVGGRSSDDS